MRVALPLILALAAALRLAWLLAVPNAQVADASWYYARALSLASGEGYSVGGAATAFWPVGYPAFLGALLAIFGPSPAVGELANVALALAALALAYALAQRLFARPAAARHTALLLALYPAAIAHTSLLLSELLFLPLMLLGVLLLLPAGRPPAATALRLAGAGAVLGLATLTRPQAVLIPLAVFLALAVGRRTAAGRASSWAALGARCALVYLALLLTLVPWTTRNLRVFGSPVFVSTNGGFNLYVGNGLFATGTNLPQAVIDAQIAPLAAMAPGEAAADRLLAGKALEAVRARPLTALALLPRKLWYLFRSDIEAVKLNELGIAPLRGARRAALFAFKLLAQGYYLAIVLAAITALTLRRRMPPSPLPGVGLAIVLAFTLFQLAYFGNDRFHFPMMPWLAMYAACLTSYWREATGAGPRNTPAANE